MKSIKYIVALMMGTAVTTSCVDDFKVGDAFLEKAPGVDVNIDTVFSKAEYVRNFLWGAYGQIYCIYTSGNMMNGAPIDALSDSYQCYCNWGAPPQCYYPGLLNEDCQDTDNGNFYGKFSYSTKSPSYSSDGRVSVYETIRKCWQLIENIDRVPESEMTSAEKSRLKGEAYTIMASRYFDAFRNFGGLCLVDHAYGMGEDFTSGRSTAWETVEFIDGLIQKAIDEPGFIWAIPNEDLSSWSGRLTRASARALRAKLWMHAASPLFNNNEPYMTYDESKVTEFTNIQHVWFGHEDHQLWERCLKACDDFFLDNDTNKLAPGYYQLVRATEETEAGYRMAYRNAYRYRNTETNHEKLFDAHPTTTLSGGSWGWGWEGFALDGYRQGGAVPTCELVECFGMSDGRNYPYADMDIYGPGKNPNGVDIFVNRDPRLYETVAVPRQNFDAGTVGDFQGQQYIDTWQGGILQSHTAFNGFDEDHRSGLNKFKWMLDYDASKMDDKAIGVAYIRLAEMYLISAEANAEMDHLDKALADLHVVRSRVGLGEIDKMNPSLNLRTNKANLIEEILRERNCEIGAECGDRVYDMIRRKRQDLFCKPLHELHTYALDASGKRVEAAYVSGTPWPKFEYERPVITDGARKWWEPGFWTNKWYLDPVSRNEIQKGYGLTQNPGW